MRWEDERESTNIEDRRDEDGNSGFGLGGRGGGGLNLSGGRLSVGAIVLALVGMYFGVDPQLLLGLVGGGAPPATQQQRQYTPVQHSAQEQKQARFVSVVLASTEDVWSRTLPEAGYRYEAPKLVLFTGHVQSACGMANAAVGPFYCPGDRKVYIDLAFYDELKNRFKAPGDAANAYVIAHEIGHHVQNLIGVLPKINAMQRRVSESEQRKLQVRIELQADCLAGIWVNRAQQSKQLFERGDMEAALTAASAVGDDNIQKQARGYVTPDSFTHGSSKQRMTWFTRGADSGQIGQCDTFSAKDL